MDNVNMTVRGEKVLLYRAADEREGTPFTGDVTLRMGACIKV